MNKFADVFLAHFPGLFVVLGEPERAADPEDGDKAGEEHQPLLQLHPERGVRRRALCLGNCVYQREWTACSPVNRCSASSHAQSSSVLFTATRGSSSLLLLFFVIRSVWRAC